MTFLIFVSNSFALWAIWSTLLCNVCAFLAFTWTYMENKLINNKLSWWGRKPTIFWKEKKVNVIDPIHYLLLQSFKFMIQITQFFFQAIHFWSMIWNGRTVVEQLILKVKYTVNLTLEWEFGISSVNLVNQVIWKGSLSKNNADTEGKKGSLKKAMWRIYFLMWIVTWL